MRAARHAIAAGMSAFLLSLPSPLSSAPCANTARQVRRPAVPTMARLTAIARLVAVLTAAAASAFTAVPLPHAARPTKPVVAARMAEESSRGGLRILEWIPSQQLLVGTAKFVVNTLWLIMVSELAPQSKEGDYVRPAPQMGAAATWPADLPGVAGRYHVYVGNACPWCHRVSIVLALRQLAGDVISSTRLDDDPQRASRGGWCSSGLNPDPSPSS